MGLHHERRNSATKSDDYGCLASKANLVVIAISKGPTGDSCGMVVVLVGGSNMSLCCHGATTRVVTPASRTSIRVRIPYLSPIFSPESTIRYY
jgi:hypothetical protein